MVFMIASRNIYVPPSNPYALEEGYVGPIGTRDDSNGTINLWMGGGFGYGCNYPDDVPHVSLAITINGVDYPLESLDNMIRKPSILSSDGICNVALRNVTTDPSPVNVVLGLPFFRSAYV